MWVLRTKPVTSVIAASALNLSHSSSDPHPKVVLTKSHRAAADLGYIFLLQ